MRTCGGCQACCEVIGIYPDNDRSKPPTSPAFEKCEHQCEDGCAIYSRRPTPCFVYRCMWHLGWGSDDDRPDKLGLILEAHPDAKHIVAIVETRSDAHKEERATIRLLQIRAQVPIVLVTPYGGGEEMLINADQELADWVKKQGLLNIGKPLQEHRNEAR